MVGLGPPATRTRRDPPAGTENQAGTRKSRKARRAASVPDEAQGPEEKDKALNEIYETAENYVKDGIESAELFAHPRPTYPLKTKFEKKVRIHQEYLRKMQADSSVGSSEDSIGGAGDAAGGVK